MNALFEMADFFVGFDLFKKDKKGVSSGDHRLTQNGGTDRVKPPHFHIYSSKDKSFSYEIDLQKLLCKDEIFIIMIKEGNSKIVPGEEGQERYFKIAKKIYNLMQLKPNVKKPDYLKGCCNNVEAAIRIFDEDADLVQTAGYNVPNDEKLLKILQEKSDTMKILPKYNPCFDHIPKNVRDKYKECFQKPF